MQANNASPTAENKPHRLIMLSSAEESAPNGCGEVSSTEERAGKARGKVSSTEESVKKLVAGFPPWRTVQNQLSRNESKL